MDRSESRCRHRQDRCFRQPLRRKRGVAKEGDKTGKSGPVSRGDGADKSERRKRLRAVETTGEAARCHTTKLKPAGSPEEPLVRLLNPREVADPIAQIFPGLSGRYGRPA